METSLTTTEPVLKTIHLNRNLNELVAQCYDTAESLQKISEIFDTLDANGKSFAPNSESCIIKYLFKIIPKPGDGVPVHYAEFLNAMHKFYLAYKILQSDSTVDNREINELLERLAGQIESLQIFKYQKRT